jgi:hypothetical protein
MSNIKLYPPELLEIFKEYDHYKVFPIIYSIKDKLSNYSDDPFDLCQLCFINNINNSYTDDNTYDNYDDNDDNRENINMNVVNHLANKNYSIQLLCKDCECLFDEQDVFKLVQQILNYSYHFESNNRFNEFIKLFGKYVSNPYEKLLNEYFSYDMGNYYMYHKRCNHFTGLLNKADNVNILCPFILDIINNINNLYFTDYLRVCPIQYIEILIEKGIDINYVFNLNKHMGNQTVFGSLLYNYIDCDYNTHIDIERILKLVSLGADVNAGNPLKYITGMQYENRPIRIEKIKCLKNISVNFDNRCVNNCSSVEECKFHVMLYDTRLGKLIQQL